MPDPDPGNLTYGLHLNNPDIVVSAIANHVNDCIEDAKTLRSWRGKSAGGLITLAVLFYALLIGMVCVVGIWPDHFATLLQAQTVCIVIIIAFASIPTLIIIGVMRAIFGPRNQQTGAPYSPLHAVLQLMKDVNGSSS